VPLALVETPVLLMPAISLGPENQDFIPAFFEIYPGGLQVSLCLTCLVTPARHVSFTRMKTARSAVQPDHRLRAPDNYPCARTSANRVQVPACADSRLAKKHSPPYAGWYERISSLSPSRGSLGGNDLTYSPGAVPPPSLRCLIERRQQTGIFPVDQPA